MHLPGVLRISDPAKGRMTPLLVDSPHSGRVYPPSWEHTCAREVLERYEDRFVDRLVADMHHLGATVICAEAPRTFIDLNRAVDDISPRHLDGRWDGPFPLRPTRNCDMGTGLIWVNAGGQPIATRSPSAGAVLARIETYYRPYYAALEDRAAMLKARFGRFCHLNIHSMPPDVNNGQTDIVLGDLDGQSCSTDFLDVVAGAFARAGLRVAFNTPYKGAALTRLFGRPQRRSESLQIEISKALYLESDLRTEVPEGFARLKDVLEDVARAAGAYALSVSNTAVKESRKAASSSAIGTFRPSAASEVTP